MTTGASARTSKKTKMPACDASNLSAVPLATTRTNGPRTHTSKDSYYSHGLGVMNTCDVDLMARDAHHRPGLHLWLFGVVSGVSFELRRWLRVALAGAVDASPEHAVGQRELFLLQALGRGKLQKIPRLEQAQGLGARGARARRARGGSREIRTT